ncbi:MAG: hypothetical protein OXC48_07735 [Endozoicomonadaceae bacterium]|nr:hypothetical protein [Endozoicomonadaceae bacterium]
MTIEEKKVFVNSSMETSTKAPDNEKFMTQAKVSEGTTDSKIGKSVIKDFCEDFCEKVKSAISSKKFQIALKVLAVFGIGANTMLFIFCPPVSAVVIGSIIALLSAVNFINWLKELPQKPAEPALDAVTGSINNNNAALTELIAVMKDYTEQVHALQLQQRDNPERDNLGFKMDQLQALLLQQHQAKKEDQSCVTSPVTKQQTATEKQSEIKVKAGAEIEASDHISREQRMSQDLTKLLVRYNLVLAESG